MKHSTGPAEPPSVSKKATSEPPKAAAVPETPALPKVPSSKDSGCGQADCCKTSKEEKSASQSDCCGASKPAKAAEPLPKVHLGKGISFFRNVLTSRRWAQNILWIHLRGRSGFFYQRILIR